MEKAAKVAAQEAAAKVAASAAAAKKEGRKSSDKTSGAGRAAAKPKERNHLAPSAGSSQGRAASAARSDQDDPFAFGGDEDDPFTFGGTDSAQPSKRRASGVPNNAKRAAVPKARAETPPTPSKAAREAEPEPLGGEQRAKLAALKVAELRSLLESAGVEVTGKKVVKAELLRRAEEAAVAGFLMLDPEPAAATPRTAAAAKAAAAEATAAAEAIEAAEAAEAAEKTAEEAAARLQAPQSQPAVFTAPVERKRPALAPATPAAAGAAQKGACRNLDCEPGQQRPTPRWRPHSVRTERSRRLYPILHEIRCPLQQARGNGESSMCPSSSPKAGEGAGGAAAPAQRRKSGRQPAARPSGVTFPGGGLAGKAATPDTPHSKPPAKPSPPATLPATPPATQPAAPRARRGHKAADVPWPAAEEAAARQQDQTFHYYGDTSVTGPRHVLYRRPLASPARVTIWAPIGLRSSLSSMRRPSTSSGSSRRRSRSSQLPRRRRFARDSTLAPSWSARRSRSAPLRLLGAQRSPFGTPVCSSSASASWATCRSRPSRTR